MDSRGKNKKEKYAKLLLGISEGNEKAFSELYDIFYPELTRHVLSKVNDQIIAEDILHDLFFSLWKNRESILEIKSVPAYLYSSVRYLILRYYRMKKVQEFNSSDLDDIEGVLDEVSIEDRLYYRYILDEVQSEIENLPEKCKEVFKLSREKYLSIQQISEKLSISESTVKKHINRALRQLRSFTKGKFSFILFF